jgi:hypothetical protein
MFQLNISNFSVVVIIDVGCSSVIKRVFAPTMPSAHLSWNRLITSWNWLDMSWNSLIMSWVWLSSVFLDTY